ncbi:hypothetical protein [Flagellimonas sp. CMM7]|uniref:hypothetical protein n=1 Tax=Flagellimonas sp. CMM7 TaxID=2654676 RepID=UPI0013D14BFE|nr:hypothetical protein [Flagellimonas sp. CMM7]UII79563.1 hypothetical protein LV704_18120 [Flagellimonas sp. CMM7]
MKKLFRYGVEETMKIENESIYAVVIDCGTVITNDTLAAINDLRHIDVQLQLVRNGQDPVDIFNGHLDEILTGYYAQEVEYLLAKKPFGLTHKFTIDLDGVLVLSGGDKLFLTIDAGEAAFTNLDIARPLSYVKAYTLPSNGVQSPIACVKSHSINNGDIDIDMELGDNVQKITAALDFTAPYATSAKAKFSNNVTVLGDGGYERSLPKEALEAENIMMFDDNPESDVNQLVVFKAKDRVLHGAKIKARLTQAADGLARIIVKSYKNI